MISRRLFPSFSALALAALLAAATTANAAFLDGRVVNYSVRQENGVTYQMDFYVVAFDGSHFSNGGTWTIYSGSKTVDLNDKKDLKELKTTLLKAMDEYAYLDITTSRSDAKFTPGTKVDVVVYRDR